MVVTGNDTTPLNKQNVVIVECIQVYYSSGHRKARNLQGGRSLYPLEAIWGLGAKPSAAGGT